MFTRFIALLSVVALAVAVPGVSEARGNSQCDGGAVKCCNQDISGSTPFKSDGKDLIDATVTAVVNAAIQCTPIDVIGIGSGAQCQSQTVCCTGDQTGLVNIQCLPIGANAA